MLRDDIILKQIKQLVEALVRLRRSKREQDPALHQHIDELLEQHTGLKPELLRRMSARSLLEALSPGGKLNQPAAVACGVLLAEEAELFDKEGDPARARHDRTLALSLLMAVEEAVGPALEAAEDDEEEHPFEPYLALIDPLLDQVDDEGGG